MLKEDEILKFIQEDKVSTKKHLASIGQKYYDADHDIITCKNCKCERKEYNNDITGSIESTELD